MLLIAAALAEELNTALDLCHSQTRVGRGECRLSTGVFGEQTIHFLKTGAGPKKAAKKMDAVLAVLRPQRILIVGYAGALAPEPCLGDLIVMQRASIFGANEVKRRPLDQVDLSESFDLWGGSELFDLAQTLGMPAHRGHGLTSPFIIGDPIQKQTLHRRFQALSIDMETAALARVAHTAGIPISCIRAVSDEATDDFLAPFTYDPSASSMGMALRVLAAGNWGKRFHAWRERAGKARESLRSFLRYYLEEWAKAGAEDSGTLPAS